MTRRPPSLVLIADVIQKAVEEYSELADEQDAFVGDGGWFIDSFRKQIEIYQAYWRDDPQFDDAHRAAAAPLACPEMDAAMLLRLARFAIQGNFGRARSRKVRSDFDLHEHVHRVAAIAADGWCRTWWETTAWGWTCSGPGGGQWKLLLRDGRLMEAEDGLSPQCSAVFRLDCAHVPRLGRPQAGGRRGRAIRTAGHRGERLGAGPVGRDPRGRRGQRRPAARHVAGTLRVPSA